MSQKTPVSQRKDKTQTERQDEQIAKRQGLSSTTDKALSEPHNKKTHYSIKNWPRDRRRHFPKEGNEG